MTVDVTLPSGAELKITPAPFKEAKALFQAFLDEAKNLSIAPSQVEIYKSIFCLAFSSPRIEKAQWECLKRCTYNDLKITEDTFEPLEAREDYLKVLTEVVKVNVSPFVKGLSADFGEMFRTILGSSQASTSPTTN